MERTTGYWAYINDDGTGHRSTQVHIEANGKPFCGSRVDSKMKYQFCAAGACMDHLECLHCHKKLEREWRDKKREIEKNRSYEGKVHTRKCKCCGHHEVGINARGKFIPIRPEDKVILYQQEGHKEEN